LTGIKLGKAKKDEYRDYIMAPGPGKYEPKIIKFKDEHGTKMGKYNR